MGLSFRQRPHSLNNRQVVEEMKNGGALELNAVGVGRSKHESAASASALAERLAGNVNKHRLTRDMQMYQEFNEEEALDAM